MQLQRLERLKRGTYRRKSTRGGEIAPIKDGAHRREKEQRCKKDKESGRKAGDTAR